MKLTKQDKINYINNYFHQYYEINLNKNIITTDFVNLVMPIESLSDIQGSTTEEYHFTHTNPFSEDDDIQAILQKYEDVSFDESTLVNAFCLRVIDGDTLEVNIPYQSPYNENEINVNKEIIRLVGVNTPEQIKKGNETIKYDGYDESKLFLEKLVYDKNFFEKFINTEKYHKEMNNNTPTGRLYYTNDKGETVYIKNPKKIQLKVDSRRRRDKYNRVLAVLVVDKKNANEIILKEGFGEIMYIPPSEFNPFDWKDVNTPISVYKFNNTSINFLSKFFNSDYSNIVFTPKNDFNIVYPCQVYKNVIYVRLLPFAQNIVMHLFPKSYNCSDDILFLTDDMTNKRTFTQSSKNKYKFYEDRGNINAYYQVNGKDRDRTKLNSTAAYKSSDWNNEWCEFNYNIEKDGYGFNNIEVCAGYSYNNTSPYHALHYFGVKDNSDKPIEDRATLIDVNTDKVLNKRNILTQMIPDDKNSVDTEDDTLSVPLHNNIKIYNAYINDINHTDIIHKTHHKKLKYMNDVLYSEEDMNHNTANNKQYAVTEWIDILKDGYNSHYNG